MTTRKPTSLITRIMIGLAAGIIVGLLLNQFPEQKTWFIDNLLQPAGDLFIKLMKMIVVPLVFACMTVGIAPAMTGTESTHEGLYVNQHSNWRIMVGRYVGEYCI